MERQFPYPLNSKASSMNFSIIRYESFAFYYLSG